MKITLLVTGKTTEKYLQEGIARYAQRLQYYVSFNIREIDGIRNAKNLSCEQLKTMEGELILRQLKPNEDLLLLDEHGETYTSEEWAKYLEKKLLYTTKSMVFAAGGAFGFSEKVYRRASGKISLSRLTFSHQMVRLIFTEQLYRAFTIIKGEPYHHP